MSKGYRYSNEFKQEAINQVTVHGYAVVDVATRLGISDKTLYNWWLITSFRSLNNIMPISFFLPAFTSTYFYSF